MVPRKTAARGVVECDIARELPEMTGEARARIAASPTAQSPWIYSNVFVFAGGALT